LYASVCSVLLAASAAAPAMAGASETEADPNALAVKAMDTLSRGDARGAVPLFDRAINSRRLDPETLASALVNRALARQKLGQHEKAIGDYDAALRIDALSARQRAIALYNRGISWRALGKSAQAIEDFTSALFYDPYFAQAYYSRANVLHRSGQYLFALADYDKALKYGYERPYQAHYAKAMILDVLGRKADARDALYAALKSKPGYSPARRKLAALLKDGGDKGVRLAALAPAMGFLLVASVSTAIVLNVSPLAVELLAGPTQREEAGRFLNALLVARVPLFFFQAVQASLLPKLSSLAADGHLEEFRQVLGRLLALVAALGVVAVAACAVAGHLVVEMAFGAEFAVGRRDMVLLAASSAVLMIVLSLAQALIAQRCQGRMALAWLAGLCAFPVVLAFGGDLFLRVELALLATVVTAMVAMAVLLARRPGLLH